MNSPLHDFQQHTSTHIHTLISSQFLVQSAHEAELAGTQELAKAEQVLSLAASRKADSSESTS
jgi:hypothetical protein